MGTLPQDELDVLCAKPNFTRTAERGLKRGREEVKKNEELGVYTNLNDIYIPAHLLEHMEDASIKLDDSGPGPRRIIILGCKKNIDAFRRANVVLGDGTFRTAPLLWAQVYTLHVSEFGPSLCRFLLFVA